MLSNQGGIYPQVHNIILLVDLLLAFVHPMQYNECVQTGKVKIGCWSGGTNS